MKWVGIIELLRFLGNSARKGFLGSLLAMALISAGAGYIGYAYANDLHSQAMEKIKKNSETNVVQNAQLVQVTATLQIMQNTLVNVNDTVKDVKKTVDKTGDRMYRLVRDVAEIKSKTR